MQVRFDNLEILCYIVCIKAAMKTRGLVRYPEREPLWCKASVPLPMPIPLLSCVCGNAMPGAPVKASMSGLCNEATRVEPWNTLKFVSHP